MVRSRIRTAASLAAVIMATLVVPCVRADVAIERFGERLADMLQSGDADGFTEVIDRDTLIDRALAGLEGDDRLVVEVGKGLHGALARVGAVLNQNLGPTA